MKIIKSFTLVETLVATLLITVAFGVLLPSMSHFIDILDVSKNRDIAANAVSEILAEIGSDAISTMQATYDGKTFPVPELQPLAGTGITEPGSITVNSVPYTTDLFNVVVRVDWQQRGRPMNVEYSTVFVEK